MREGERDDPELVERGIELRHRRQLAAVRNWLGPVTHVFMCARRSTPPTPDRSQSVNRRAQLELPNLPIGDPRHVKTRGDPVCPVPSSSARVE